jgi:hypothetical protein
MNKAVQEYRDILTSAPNGWLMEYYAEKEPRKMGGYNILCKFDKNGEVTLAAEFATSNYDIAEKVTSWFQVIPNQGPVLTFDTYNELIHIFSTPSSSDFNGYEGDFEFTFMEVSNAKIVLNGKKSKLNIVLTRNSETLDWDDYLHRIDEMVAAAEVYSNFTVELDGTEIGSCIMNTNRLYTFSVGNATILQNAIYTPTGIKFYNPVELGGKTVQNFKWNEADKTYVCEDGANMVFKVFKAPTYLFYNEYLGKYKATFFEYTNAAAIELEVEVVEKVKNASYTIKGLMPFEAELTYDRSTGSVSIRGGQVLGTSGVNNVLIAIWMVDSPGSLSWGTSYSYKGVWKADENKISFFNGGVATLDNPRGMILWMTDAAGNSAGAYTAQRYNRFIDMILEPLN